MKNDMIKFYEIETNMQKASDLLLQYENYLLKKASLFSNNYDQVQELFLEARIVFFHAFYSFKEGKQSFTNYLNKCLRNGFLNFLEKDNRYIELEDPENEKEDICFIKNIYLKEAIHNMSEEAKYAVNLVLNNTDKTLNKPRKIKGMLIKETKWNWFTLQKVYKEINQVLDDLKSI